MKIIKNRRQVLHSILLGAGVTALGIPATAAPPKKKIPTSFIKTSDGINLWCQDWGKGKTILFVAPWAMNSNWWEYQVSYLSRQEFRCVAYDRRGHGRSDWPSHGYNFDTLSDDLATVIKELDLHDVILVGHSMGCGEVVRYMSRFNGDRVSKVVLIATITPFTLKTSDHPEGVERKALEDGRIKLRKDRAHQIADAAAAFFDAAGNNTSKEILEWWTRMVVDGTSMQVMLGLHEVFTETDFRPDLGKINKPVLLIHGDKDVSTALDFTSRRSAALIPGSELRIYEGAAHGLPVTHMDRLNADLEAFAKS